MQGRKDDRNKRPSYAASLAADVFLVEGLSAVREYLRLRPKCVKSLECVPGMEGKLQEAVKSLGVDMRARVLSDVEERRSSSPVWATVQLQPLDEASWLSRIASRERDLTVALDHVTDPRNVGAIVRTAAFFGIREVIVPEDRQGLITNGAVASAQGGFAACDLVKVTNLSRVLERLKEKHGYWIIGTDMGGETLEKAPKGFDKALLVLGSEDKGLSANIQSKCDVKVAIAGKSQSSKEKGGDAPWTLESLNVSVAAGIFIHAFSRA